MAEKSYRKATEKEIKRGAKKTTDELSKAEAMKYFQKRSKDTGSKQFRWRGDVYDLEGNKVGGKKTEDKKSPAPEKSPRPAPRSRAAADIETTKLPKQGASGRGDGRAERIRRMTDAALTRAETERKTSLTGPTQRTAFGDVPVSSPYRSQSETRREREAAARRKAEEEGGRKSRLGRMMDRLGLSEGGMVKKSGYANGGMVKANCGASMKPDGKRKK